MYREKTGSPSDVNSLDKHDGDIANDHWGEGMKNDGH